MRLQSSGHNPGASAYRVVVEVADLGAKCSCPSRKFPCKHSLALMWWFAERPDRFTEVILISDLAEGGDRDQLLARAASLVESGVNLIALLALSDDGRTWHDEANAKAFAALGCPVFACTPDQFPDLMAAALQRRDVAAWAAERDIAVVRG